MHTFFNINPGPYIKILKPWKLMNIWSAIGCSKILFSRGCKNFGTLVCCFHSGIEQLTFWQTYFSKQPEQHFESVKVFTSVSCCVFHLLIAELSSLLVGINSGITHNATEISSSETVFRWVPSVYLHSRVNCALST